MTAQVVRDDILKRRILRLLFDSLGLTLIMNIGLHCLAHRDANDFDNVTSPTLPQSDPLWSTLKSSADNPRKLRDDSYPLWEWNTLWQRKNWLHTLSNFFFCHNAFCAQFKIMLQILLIIVTVILEFADAFNLEPSRSFVWDNDYVRTQEFWHAVYNSISQLYRGGQCTYVSMHPGISTHQYLHNMP